MYLCYLDESGSPEATGNTDCFLLLGLAIPADKWKECDLQVDQIKVSYGLGEAEVHTAWMYRDYPEQRVVPDFETLDWDARRRAVLGVRALNLGRARSRTQHKELIKNYRKTEAYVHLTRSERRGCLQQLASLLGSWGHARVFADAHSKRYAPGVDHFGFAFEQVVTRFNTFLTYTDGPLGLLVQDNNQTMARKLTAVMRQYHRSGTFWSRIDRIVETPLFVDSALTSMVQLADLAAFATRRFFDNSERDLFHRVRPRFDRWHGRLVGLRHYTGQHQCRCEVCIDHGRYSAPPSP